MTFFEILTLIGGSGLGLGIIAGIFKMGKVAHNIESINKNFQSIKNDITDIKLDIKNIDSRLNRLEGAFFERGQWEAKAYKISKSSNDHSE